MVSKALVAGAYHKKIEELSRFGMELHLIVPELWASQKLEAGTGEGFSIYPLKIIFNGHNHFHLYRKLSAIIEKVNPDIVHIDEEHYSLVTFQVMRLSKKIGAKTLFFTWQNIYKNYPFPFSWIEQYNLRHADIAIAGNNEAKEVLRMKGFNKEIAVIPQFGVDTQIYRKMAVPDLKDNLRLSHDFVIGYMGRFVEEKGISVLLDAIKRLKIKNVKLLLIGNGHLKSTILNKTRKLEIENKVKILDHVPSTKVPEYMNCFDCLILPSLTRPNWKEQFGRVLIEAMACEVPVIGSSSGEIPRVIGNAGLVFQEGNTNDLAEKIELLLHNRDLCKELIKKGLEKVQSKYTQKRIAEETYHVYKELMLN